MLRMHPLGDDLRLEIVPAPAIDAIADNRIREIWAREQARRAQPMFDGKLFSLLERDGAILRGYFVDYSAFVAQRAQPALRDILGIRMLAVSGLLRSPDGIVFGRRADHVLQDPRHWELVPSGGIDGTPLDPKAKLLEELAEETGCPASVITSSRVVALAEDDETGQLEICIELETGLSARELKDRHDTTGRIEYTALEIVPQAALSDFIGTHDIVELSRVLLANRGLT